MVHIMVVKRPETKSMDLENSSISLCCFSQGVARTQGEIGSYTLHFFLLIKALRGNHLINILLVWGTLSKGVSPEGRR